MQNSYTNQAKFDIVAAYSNGKPVAILCAEHGIPRSTIYFWIKQHRKLKSNTEADVSYQDFYNLKRKHDKTGRYAKCSQSFGVQRIRSITGKIIRS